MKQVVALTKTRFVKKSSLLLAALCFTAAVQSEPLDSHVKSVEELTYGVVLYDYFQNDFFSALVEHEYATASGNSLAYEPANQVLKGGMMLSYGMPDKSEVLFNALLDQTVSTPVSNRAWYYLARIFYNKSELANANKALAKISGEIPPDIFFDYYYLSSLVGDRRGLNNLSESVQAKLSSNLPGYPYLLFNLAIEKLRQGDNSQAVNYLSQVAAYSDESEELAVLSDRANNGLAQISLDSGQLDTAWTYLTGVRTSGLYSNRALLAYAWSAIGMKRYNDAVSALKLLNQRSIAIPEVQEAIILLSHLYEQQGAAKLALKSYIDAEKTYKEGLDKIATARAAISTLNVPQEFVENIEAIITQPGWYLASPELSYKALTPFLLDLMSSNAFNEVLKELADLYAIKENLQYWLKRSGEHRIILSSAEQKNYDGKLQIFLKRSEELREKLAEQKTELKLYSLALNEKDQERMTALHEVTSKELVLLESRVAQLLDIDSAYKQPAHFQSMVDDHHERLQNHLSKTESFIHALEPVMRKLINLELDKHEKRMHYYWAQSKLAKTRLYDSNLLSLETAKLEQATDQNIKVEDGQ